MHKKRSSDCLKFTNNDKRICVVTEQDKAIAYLEKSLSNAITLAPHTFQHSYINVKLLLSILATHSPLAIIQGKRKSESHLPHQVAAKHISRPEG